jgi:hypothetical protein
MIHTVEVIAALDQGDFSLGKLRQSVPKLLAHAVGVLAEVDGVAKPTDGKLDLSVACFNIREVSGVPWLSPVTYFCIKSEITMRRD